MHVCGTHQDTLIRYGIQELLDTVNVKILAGPGCPVCVTPAREYEEAISLAEQGITITAFGDAARSPGYDRSLLDMRGSSCDVRIVYGIKDALEIAKKKETEVVFVAVGFETTAPGTAIALKETPPNNFSILSCHRYLPPALDKLLGMGEVRIQGLIEPGHVSTIIGAHPYQALSEKFKIPQVIAGFEPLDILVAAYMLLSQVSKAEYHVENEYSRTVHPEGNLTAQKYLKEVFEPSDVPWRGFPTLDGSGMKIRREYEDFDARKKHEDILENVDQSRFQEPEGCHCGEVLRGVFTPTQCTLFAKACTPQTPVGPCMVSIEGSCNIEYKYGKR